MPRRIGNTLVPRNPVAQLARMRRAGVHERGRTAQRQRNRMHTRTLTQDWREELAFEQEMKLDRDD